MLVTNLLFSHGFTVTHRSFIQDYVMIFQIIIHLRSIRMKRFYVSERLWFFHQNYTENIHKFNGRSTKRGCVKMYTSSFLCTKPRLSQARALLFPKVFVPLGIQKISL